MVPGTCTHKHVKANLTAQTENDCKDTRDVQKKIAMIYSPLRTRKVVFTVFDLTPNFLNSVISNGSFRNSKVVLQIGLNWRTKWIYKLESVLTNFNRNKYILHLYRRSIWLVICLQPHLIIFCH